MKLEDASIAERIEKSLPSHGCVPNPPNAIGFDPAPSERGLLQRLRAVLVP
jgi:hypothetical protein